MKKMVDCGQTDNVAGEMERQDTTDVEDNLGMTDISVLPLLSFHIMIICHHLTLFLDKSQLYQD